MAPNTAPPQFNPQNVNVPAQMNPVNAGQYQSNRGGRPRSSLDGISTSAIKQANVADTGSMGAVSSTKLEGRFEESARKRVRVSHNPAETRPSVGFASASAGASATASVYRPSVGFASNTMFGAPKFQMGTSGTPAKPRVRRGTPTPKPRVGGFGTYQKTATRSRIRANFRPMSKYLTSNSKSTEEKKMALNQSLAQQILADTQGKLYSLGLKDMLGEEEESSKPKTFAEEAVAVKRSVPRVRMTRVLGTGQSGGMRVNLSAEEEKAVGAMNATAAAPQLTNGADATTGAGGKRKAPAAEGASIPGVLRTPVIATGAVPPASTKKAVTFTSSTWAPQQPVAEEEEKSNDVESDEPFVCKPMPKSGVMSSLDPVCKDVPRSLLESLRQEVNTPEWQRRARSEDFGLFGPDALTPTPAKKKSRTGTPHPKKNEAAAPNLVDESSKAPFNFMPKSNAGLSPAYKYKDVSSPKPTPVEVKTPSKSAIKSLQKDFSPETDSTPPSTDTSAPPPAASGWGNMFASKPGEWKCDTCYVKNPKEKNQCMSCETAKPGDVASSSKTPKKAAKVDDSKAGGFAFGGQTQSSGNIGAGGFSFGGAAASKPAETSGTSTGGFSFSGASATKHEKTSDAGFTFGGATAVKPSESTGTGFTFGASASKPSDDAAKPSTDVKPSSTGFTFGTTPGDKQKDTPSAGFTFGSTATTPAKTTEKESSVKAGAAFLFGGASQIPSTEARTDDVKPTTFAFGSQTPAKKAPESSTTPGAAFAFGDAKTDSPKNDILAFGAKTPADDEKKSSDSDGAAFSFGQVTSAAKPGQPSFAFGAATTPAAIETKAAPGFSFGGANTTTPAPTSADSTKPTTPAFSFGGANATTPTAPTTTDPSKTNAALSFGGSTTPAAPTASDTSKSNTAAFSFGSHAASTSTDASKTNTPAFSFGGAASAPAATSNATFSFGSAPASTAPTIPPPATTPGASFGGAMASTPAPSAGFSFGGGTAATGFGSAAKPATAGFTPAAAPATTAFTFGGPPTTPATGSFGMPPNKNAPASSFGFGLTPAAAPAAGGFGGGGFGAAPATTPAASSFGGGGFGAGATPSAATPGGFSIGTSEKKSTGRRILKARRPPK